LYDFHAIVCPCPPGSDRLSFLAEVRYLSQHPPRFSVLSPDLTENLRRAFTSHPWVAEVRSVTILPGQVCVDLRFRTPMLQVVLIQGPPRWVDESGVLLPSLVPHQQRDAPVAVLLTPRQSPTTPAGQRWEDPVVLQALALVRAYQPRQLEFRQRYWELTLANGQTLYVTGQSWE
jgi:cell division septal protein FtsQ